MKRVKFIIQGKAQGSETKKLKNRLKKITWVITLQDLKRFEFCKSEPF